MGALADRPSLVVGIVLAITAVFAVGALRVRIDSSAGTLVDRASADWAYYQDTRSTFGSDEIDIIAIVSSDAFAVGTLAKIDALTRRLLHVDGVADVESLATVRNFTANADGDIDRSPVMDTVPTTEAAIAALRETVRQNPLIHGTLVSTDERVAALYVTYDEMSDAELVSSGVLHRVDSILKEYEGPETLHFGGSVRTKVVMAERMRDDIFRFAPLSFGVVCITLLLAFRTFRGMAVPALTVGVGTIWTMGLMGFLDVPINVVTLILPTFLMAVGNAYATHVVSNFDDCLRRGLPPARAAKEAVMHVGAPVFVTAITTIAGFASLLAYRINAIRDLGIFSVFGISVLFVLALTFTAAVLGLLRGARAPTHLLDDGSGVLHRVLDAIGRCSVRHRGAILFATIGVGLAFAWGIRSLEIDTTYLKFFHANDPVRISLEAIDEHLGVGSTSFYVVVDGPEQDSIVRPDTLHRIATLQEFVERLPAVDATTSIVDYVKLINRTLHDNSPTDYALPDSAAAVAQYMLLLDPKSTDGVLSGDSSRGAILVRSRVQTSAAMNDLVARIEGFAADAFPTGYAVHATGARVVFDKTADDLAKGQLGSLVVALVVILAILSLQFLSLRYGIVAMAPNLIPIVGFFGLLGWTGTPLGLGTATIAAIALGIGVDEAVHLLSEFNVQTKKHTDQAAAVQAALHVVGPPLIFSTGSLFFGVLVLLSSGFVPLQQFSVLTAFNIAASLVVDLFVLPAILVTARFITLWDVLSTKLGGAPHEEIPLLRGLTKSQARATVVTCGLITIPEGGVVMRQGEAADAMYVIVTGRARVERRDGDHITVVGEIRRGDVIGEMGLVRKQPRMADVIAIEATELLVVNQRFLSTLQQRSPRTAAVVFFNLTQILSDRLEEAHLRGVYLPSSETMRAHVA